MLRHLDRGSQEVDNGHYLQHEYVFGATAAAALYRRRDDRRYRDRRRIFRSRFFRLPRRCRRGLARAIHGLALHLHAARARLSRAQRSARQPPGAAAGHQHALGEESLPDAHEEHDRRSVPAQLVLHHGARPGGDGLLPGARAEFAQSILVRRAELEARDGEAARNHEPQARGRRLHRELVPLRSSEQPGEQTQDRRARWRKSKAARG